MKKKLIFMLAILFAFVLMIGCIKDEKNNSEELLPLTGDWQGTITVDNDVFDFKLVLDQGGNKLEGEFIFFNSEYSFPYELLSSSRISSKTVFIDFDEDIYQFRLTGTLNDSFDAMQGTHTVNGVSKPYLVWNAYRI
jgi:hypothetical protein